MVSVSDCHMMRHRDGVCVCVCVGGGVLSPTVT